MGSEGSGLNGQGTGNGNGVGLKRDGESDETPLRILLPTMVALFSAIILSALDGESPLCPHCA